MKKIFFFILCFFSLSSCGLDTFYYLDPPKEDGHTISYESDDQTLAYFSFVTNESGDNGALSGDGSPFLFLGTEIYYKIYNNQGTMESAISSIDVLNSSSDVSAAATSLINTKKYVPLKIMGKNLSPILETTGTSRYVYLRLNDYSSDSKFSRCMLTGSSKMSYRTASDTLLGIPCRNALGKNYGFNFKKNDTTSNPPPCQGDEDVEWSSSSTKDGVWYVNLYAVSVGRDTSFAQSYSKVLHIGSIKIDEEWYKD